MKYDSEQSAARVRDTLQQIRDGCFAGIKKKEKEIIIRDVCIKNAISEKHIRAVGGFS